MHGVFVTALVIAISAAVIDRSAAADRGESSVPLIIDARGGIQVAVRVNAHGPFTFLLDTGSSRTIIAEDLARELAAPTVARTEVVTSGGTDARMVVRLESMSIGAARRAAVLAPAVPAERLSPLGARVRGIVGQDFLSGLDYTLDYRRSRLAWDRPVSCNASGAIALAASEGRFVARVYDEESGATLRLVPDSGAEALIVFRPARATPMRAPVTVRGIAEGARIGERMAMRLRLGTVTTGDVDAVAIDRDEPDVDGLLPLHRFSSVSFAAGGACMVVR